MQKALVIGGSVAGLSSAYLLAQRGWDVELWRSEPRSSPTLVLNDTTCDLLQDIWQLEDRFWDHFHALNQRNVCWGMGAPVMSIPQQSVAIRGNCLIERLLERLLRDHNRLVHVNESPASLEQLISPDFLQDTRQKFAWVVDAGGRRSAIAKSLGAAERYPFGRRCVISQEVILTRTHEQSTCWIETVSDGWMFLAPLGRSRALLQAMVPLVSEAPSLILTTLLEQTRIIKTFVSSLLDSTSVFEAFPQILDPLCGTGWIAVGDAALSLDPICGDGTGYAIRGAILATSVIDGIASGLVISDCLRHYTLRLHKTFFSHLKECLKYYSAGFSTSDWKAEIERMQKVRFNNEYDMANTEGFVYRLEGFSLVPLTLENYL